MFPLRISIDAVYSSLVTPWAFSFVLTPTHQYISKIERGLHGTMHKYKNSWDKTCLKPILSGWSPDPKLTWPNCANGGVTKFRHGRSRDPGNLIITFPPLTFVAWQGTPGKGGQQSLAEAHIHEAVDDGVDAGRRVRQQLDKGNGSAWEGSFGWVLVKCFPCVYGIKRHPADEEHSYNDD